MTTANLTDLYQGIKTYDAMGPEVFNIWLAAELHLHVDDPEAIALLLRQGANPVRSHDWNGFPDVLQHAIQHAGAADVQVVQMLLEAGADPNYHERGTGTTALQVCTNPAVAELLIQHNAH
jgi:hypothetical protein